VAVAAAAAATSINQPGWKIQIPEDFFDVHVAKKGGNPRCSNPWHLPVMTRSRPLSAVAAVVVAAVAALVAEAEQVPHNPFSVV
jgi:hypothetical protein